MTDEDRTAMRKRGTMLLRVTQARRIASDVQLFELRDPDGGDLPVFTAGAHLTVVTSNGLERKYSMTNHPAERDRYVIAVKREADGRGGSIALVDQTKVGDVLEVSSPRNAFPLAERALSHLFIAGGIGITPILPMIRHLQGTSVRFRLIYCTRSADVTAFKEELGAPELRAHVRIHHDNGDPAQSLDLWPFLERPQGTHVYCCGPAGLMQAVRDMSGHWPRSNVHFESFADPAALAKANDRALRVHLARSGTVVEVPASKSILAALREAGCDVPSSCESGCCGTCKTRLIAGEADHRDLVLTDEERPTNIMVCVSRARSDEIVIDR